MFASIIGVVRRAVFCIVVVAGICHAVVFGVVPVAVICHTVVFGVVPAVFPAVRKNHHLASSLVHDAVSRLAVHVAARVGRHNMNRADVCGCDRLLPGLPPDHHALELIQDGTAAVGAATPQPAQVLRAAQQLPRLAGTQRETFRAKARAHARAKRRARTRAHTHARAHARTQARTRARTQAWAPTNSRFLSAAPETRLGFACLAYTL